MAKQYEKIGKFLLRKVVVFLVFLNFVKINEKYTERTFLSTFQQLKWAKQPYLKKIHFPKRMNLFYERKNIEENIVFQ